MELNTLNSYKDFLINIISKVVENCNNTNFGTTTFYFDSYTTEENSLRICFGNNPDVVIYKNIDVKKFISWIFALKSFREMYGRTCYNDQLNFFCYANELEEDMLREIDNLNRIGLPGACLTEDNLEFHKKI